MIRTLQELNTAEAVSLQEFSGALSFWAALQYLQAAVRVLHSEATCQFLPSRVALVHVLAQSSALLKVSGLQPHLFAQLDDSGLPWGSVGCCPSLPPNLQPTAAAMAPI